MNPLQFFTETIRELKKVTWPSREQTVDMTLLVLGVSVVVGAYLGLLDALFQRVMGFIL